eukprot:180854-Prymnesium_polylepis.1
MAPTRRRAPRIARCAPSTRLRAPTAPRVTLAARRRRLRTTQAHSATCASGRATRRAFAHSTARRVVC